MIETENIYTMLSYIKFCCPNILQVLGQYPLKEIICDRSAYK